MRHYALAGIQHEMVNNRARGRVMVEGHGTEWGGWMAACYVCLMIWELPCVDVTCDMTRSVYSLFSGALRSVF